MAHLVHRQPAVWTRPEPRGVAGIVACLSPLGWLSLGAAVIAFGAGIQPLFGPGVIGSAPWLNIALQMFRAISDATLFALPAALMIGFPGVAKRNRWLLRGAVLLVLAELARPALSVVEGFVVDALDPGQVQIQDPSTALGLAFALAGLAAGLISIAGTWAFSDGLEDAGGRVRRFVVPTFAALGIAVVLAVYWQAIQQSVDLSTIGGWLNIVGLGLSLLLIGLWIEVGVRLVAGFVRGMVPRPAWVLGGIAGALLLIERFLSPLATLVPARSWPRSWWPCWPSRSGRCSWLVRCWAWDVERAGAGCGRRSAGCTWCTRSPRFRGRGPPWSHPGAALSRP